MLCGLKTILTDMNILNSYRHIRPKKVKYPIPEIPDDSGKKSGTDWVLPKIIGSGRVSGTRQALPMTPDMSSWAALADVSSTGQIGTLTLKTTPLSRGNQEQCQTGTRYPTRPDNF